MLVPQSGCLAGTLVVDASRVLAGPFAGQLLGDHGAEVIKVEAFDGDDTRRFGPPFVDGVAPYYLGLNRNKKDVAVDLTRPEGLDLLFRCWKRRMYSSKTSRPRPGRNGA